MRTAQDLLTDLNASDQSPRIGAKRSREIGKSVMETVIAFANEPGLGGGHLLLGVDWAADEAKALIYARETGLVDNMACRDFSGLDTLQASSLLRRLRDRGLLEKQGAGNRTHYTLIDHATTKDSHPAQGKLPLEGGNPTVEGGKQASEGGKRSLPPLPAGLAAKLSAPGQRMGGAALRQLIRDLCGWQALRGEELATLLDKDLKYLRNKHLSAMVQAGELAFQFPESPNHRLQAYQLPKSD